LFRAEGAVVPHHPAVRVLVEEDDPEIICAATEA